MKLRKFTLNLKEKLLMFTLTLHLGIMPHLSLGLLLQGLLVLSLVQGCVVREALPEVPTTLPPQLQDFLTKYVFAAYFQQCEIHVPQSCTKRGCDLCLEISTLKIIACLQGAVVNTEIYLV